MHVISKEKGKQKTQKGNNLLNIFPRIEFACHC